MPSSSLDILGLLRSFSQFVRWNMSQPYPQILLLLIQFPCFYIEMIHSRCIYCSQIRLRLYRWESDVCGGADVHIRQGCQKVPCYRYASTQCFSKTPPSREGQLRRFRAICGPSILTCQSLWVHPSPLLLQTKDLFVVDIVMRLLMNFLHFYSF